MRLGLWSDSISVLIRRDTGAHTHSLPAHPCLYMKKRSREDCSEKAAIYIRIRKGDRTRNWICWHLDRRFLAFRARCHQIQLGAGCVSHPPCGILQWQSEQTETPVKNVGEFQMSRVFPDTCCCQRLPFELFWWRDSAIPVWFSFAFPCWITKLSTFLFTYWPFVYFLSWSGSSRLLPIFKLSYFVLLICRSCQYSLNLSPLSDIPIENISSLVVACLFHSLNGIFWWTEVHDINKVLFIKPGSFREWKETLLTIVSRHG